MDGRYLNKKNNYNKFLSDWIDITIKNNSWENHKDLHLDEIDIEFKKKENWVNGSLGIYKIILEIIYGTPYNCFLLIQLTYSDSQTNLNNLKLDYIRNQMDLTPPSFYLFPKGNVNYEKTIMNLVYVESLSGEIGYKVFFKEEKETDQEYFRCLYISR